MKKYRSICLVLFFVFVNLFSPLRVFAHLGVGPPYLKVNDIYCPTNLAYVGGTALVMPQDYAPSVYLPNQPVEFLVDLQNLSFPPEVSNNMTFRWSFYQGNNFSDRKGEYQYGVKINSTFSEPRSYLLKVEAKPAGDVDFTLLDTVLVHVIPYKGYSLPVGDVEIDSKTFDPSDSVLLQDRPTFSKRVKHPVFLWDFGEGKIERGKNITKKFRKFDNFLYTRVIDDY